MRQQLRHVILPTVAHLYDFQQSELTVCDLFVVRYTASSGSGKDQSKLPAHRDGNLLSFNILLSDPSTEFTGGGTHFFSLRKTTARTQQHAERTDSPDVLDSSNSDKLQQQKYDGIQQSKQKEQSYGVTVQPQQGEVTFHTGKLLHEGNQVTSGTRYIIVGFIDVVSSKLDMLYLQSDAPNQSKQGIDIDYDCVTKAYKCL
jgi:hypothetical protein